MNNLEGMLDNRFSQLQEKIYQAKTIHMRYSMIEKHKLFLTRQAVLSIYAAWEGFLKECLLLYLQELNTLKLEYNDISESYLAFQTDNVCIFKNSKTNYATIKKLSTNLFNMYKQKVVFNTKINTESNANLKITNTLLSKLSLSVLESKKDGKDLDRLLRFRNSVAHGDDSIRIEQKDLDKFSATVQNIASDLITSILDGYNNQVYVKNA
jgi:hypothetical protein